MSVHPWNCLQQFLNKWYLESSLHKIQHIWMYMDQLPRQWVIARIYWDVLAHGTSTLLVGQNRTSIRQIKASIWMKNQIFSRDRKFILTCQRIFNVNHFGGWFPDYWTEMETEFLFYVDHSWSISIICTYY